MDARMSEARDVRWWNMTLREKRWHWNFKWGRTHVEQCYWERYTQGPFLEALFAQKTLFLLSLCVYLEERLMEFEGGV